MMIEMQVKVVKYLTGSKRVLLPSHLDDQDSPANIAQDLDASYGACYMKAELVDVHVTRMMVGTEPREARGSWRRICSSRVSANDHSSRLLNTEIVS